MPPSEKQRLKAINQALKNQTSKKQTLEKNVKNIKGRLKKTKKNLVTLSRSIQRNEQKLNTLEQHITDKEVEQLKIRQSLESDQQSISRLILALQRIKRVPPEALIVKPGAPLETAQSAMLMSNIIPTLYKESEKLKENLKALKTLSSELKSERRKALKISQSMKDEHTKLSVLIDRRQNLYKKTNKNLQEQQAHIEKISTQAKNLNELVKKLEEDKKRKKTREQSRKAIMASVTRAIPGSNKSQMPISGIVTLKYNQKDSFGAPSKGIEIAGRGGALIVAPMSGIIRFAGAFKNYGNMIILEHAGGYHSLIAGLEKIDTVVGLNVSSGEPLGYLHYASDAQSPVLYYELRFNGTPINPAKKLKGLS